MDERVVMPSTLEGHTADDLARLRDVLRDPRPNDAAGLAYSCRVALAAIVELEERVAELVGRAVARTTGEPEPERARDVTTTSMGDGLIDAQGRWIPLRLIRDVDLARHDLVLELTAAARELSGDMAAFKSRVFRDVDAFVQLSAEKYGVTIGGRKGNITLTSFDGAYRIVIQRADRLTFDERLQAAKQLVDKCIVEWTQGASDKIRALVEHAFQVDREGRISTSRVLGLRRLEIDSAEWRDAMRAIGDSITIATTTTYVRFYERVVVDGVESYRAISLDMATARESGQEAGEA